MSGLTLFDANVILRVLLNEVHHPKYSLCKDMLERPGVIAKYVVPEIVYSYLANYRKVNARLTAIELGEVELYRQDPKKYIMALPPKSGWKKEAYCNYKDSMLELLDRYPSIEVECRKLFSITLDVAITTGYDWVDCMLIAEHNISGADILSVDTHIARGIEQFSFKSERKSLGTMDLFR